jgi:hypothetical protein
MFTLLLVITQYFIKIEVILDKSINLGIVIMSG